MSALEDMIETHDKEVRLMRAANWQLHEQGVEAIAGYLQCSAQLVQDTLYQVSVESVDKPSVILEIVHGFLKTLTTYQQREKADEP